MLEINEIYLMKSTSNDGAISIKFVHDKWDLLINDIKVDANNAIEPISYYKLNGKQLISGTYFSMLKRQLMKIFNNEILSDEIGLWSWDSVSKKVRKA